MPRLGRGRAKARDQGIECMLATCRPQYGRAVFKRGWAAATNGACLANTAHELDMVSGNETDLLCSEPAALGDG